MKSNTWQKTMYDDYFADSTLNSKAFREKAVDEVDLILKKTGLTYGSVLDVPCGTGRHSMLFAKKGFDVTGIDISPACLRIAKKNFQRKNLTYQMGDMSNLKKYYGEFDLVLNLFTSFGYFATDKQNEDVLREFYRSLKKDGTFVLNLISGEWLLKVFKPNEWIETEDKYLLNRRLYDEKSKYIEAWNKVIDKKSKKEQDYYFRHRVYSTDEIRSLLKKIGFKKVTVVGNQFGEKFRKGISSHPYYFAKI